MRGRGGAGERLRIRGNVLRAHPHVGVHRSLPDCNSMQVRIRNRWQCCNYVSTGLSKRNGAKFGELSQNFPKLADGDVHREATLVGRTWGGNFKTGDISFHNPVLQLLTSIRNL